MCGRLHEDGTPEPFSLSDEERAFRHSFERLVDWYRVEQSRALWAALWPSALILLPLGSVLTAAAAFHPALRFVSPWPVLAGLALTASGPVLAMVRLLRSIQQDDLYVAIRIDGLSLRLDPAEQERTYGWDNIVHVSFDPGAQAVRVEWDAGEPVEIRGRFSSLDLPTLARRIRDARRLAIWNRLSPETLQASY